MLPLLLALVLNRIAPGTEAGPYRQPQLAAAHGRVAMVFGGPKAIYFASSNDQGKTFGAPLKVADLAVLALGRHRGPRLTILRDAMLVTAVVGEKTSTGPHAHGLPEDGNLVVWRSTDDGRTWNRAATINDSPSAAREGLHAIATGPDGTIFATWLDLRANGTRLYGARSKDGGRTWSKNVPIYSSPDGTICQCCDPSVQIDEKGAVWVMWRNVLDGSRDMFVARSRDGEQFEAPVKLGDGTWKIAACPMDGGGFYVENGRVTSAWRREGDVFVAPAGEPERRAGTGKDVAIVHGRSGAYVAWSRPTGGIEALTPGAKTPILLAPEGGFVNLTALPDGAVLAAWEANNAIEISRLN